MSAARYLLEHFYYGQFVHEGQPQGQPQLLAKSPKINDEIIRHVVERANVPPFTEDVKGTWALVRGRSRQVPFILVQAQKGILGQVMTHYIIVPAEVLKAIGGNLSALMNTVEATQPMYEKRPPPLKPLELPQATLPTLAQQVDDILELMTTTKNRANLIEPLLAAIVQGTQLVVQGAPPSLEERKTFISGLLALLPPTARFGVTFVTHSLPTTETDTQIRFYSDDPPPENTLVFNWQTAEVTGVQHEDDYSRFVISQLRLDTELVIKRNMEMATIAAWRLNEGDKLAEALAYAAKRIKLDEGMRNNQPVDKDEVSKILAEDPTLTDTLRVLYGGHLVRFSLAMEDMTHAQPVALLLRTDPELEKSILQQMNDALNDGLAWLVYESLVAWMSDPLGPEGSAWVKLTHQAILTYLGELVADKDVEEVALLLDELLNIDPGVAIGQVVPAIVEQTLAVCDDQNKLGTRLFLLALRHQDSKNLTRLLNTARFRQFIPPAVARTWDYIAAEGHSAIGAGALLDAAAAFDAAWEPVVLVRLGELVALANHYEMLDTPTISALLRVAKSTDASLYTDRLLTIVNALNDDALVSLPAPGPFQVLQLHLLLRNYEELARLMIVQSARLYPGDRQPEYLKMVERLFIETPIPAYEVPQMLQIIQGRGIKSVPYVVAAVGGLHKRLEAPELNQMADELCRQLLQSPALLEVTPPLTVMMLLGYQVQRRDIESTVQAARLVPRSATYQSAGTGIKMIAEMYKQMDWDDRSRRAALQMLRAYVRDVDEHLANRVTVYFGKELGPRVQRALEVTYLMKQFMGEMPLLDYAAAIRATAQVLEESASLYADAKTTPELQALKAALTSIPGTLPLGERRRLGRDVMVFGRGVVRLGRQYRAVRPREEPLYISRLLQAETNPRSILDVLRVMSGAISRGQRHAAPIQPTGRSPLDGRSAESLLTDVTLAIQVFTAAQEALPLNKPVKLSAQEIREAFESIWVDLDRETQAELREDLMRDLQRIPDLVAWIEASGDAKALEDSALGRKITAGRYKPKSTLEFFRFVADHFALRA